MINSLKSLLYFDSPSICDKYVFRVNCPFKSWALDDTLICMINDSAGLDVGMTTTIIRTCTVCDDENIYCIQLISICTLFKCTVNLHCWTLKNGWSFISALSSPPHHSQTTENDRTSKMKVKVTWHQHFPNQPYVSRGDQLQHTDSLYVWRLLTNQMTGSQNNWCDVHPHSGKYFEELLIYELIKMLLKLLPDCWLANGGVEVWHHCLHSSPEGTLKEFDFLFL